VSAALLDDRELLARLIAFDSVSRNSNGPIADFLTEYLAAAGCVVERLSYDTDTTPKHCVLARSGPTPADRAGLLLSGHTDVVPADEPNWTRAPFELTERDSRFVGRGTADMKGFVALAVNALARAGRGEHLARPLALLLTSDEELGCVGARRWVETYRGPPLPRDAWIGEPTRMQVIRMHKGHMKMRLTLAGKPAHSGYPHLGENAIERAGVVLTALTALVARWRDVRNESSRFFEECPYPALNLGLIRGGSAVNIVPARCEIEIGIRLLPGQSGEFATQAIAACVAELPDHVRRHVHVEVTNDNPPMLCSESAPLLAVLAQESGNRPERGASYATDGGWLATAGHDCVVCGPGNIKDAHRADESLAIDEWRQARAMLDRVIQRCCPPR
jgi:acetylornithine deacetylase